MSGITKDQWPTFVHDVFRVCKPGTGWAQLIEGSASLYCDDGSVPNDSPVFKVSHFTTWFTKVSTIRTRNLGGRGEFDLD